METKCAKGVMMVGLAYTKRSTDLIRTVINETAAALSGEMHFSIEGLTDGTQPYVLDCGIIIYCTERSLACVSLGCKFWFAKLQRVCSIHSGPHQTKIPTLLTPSPIYSYTKTSC